MKLMEVVTVSYFLVDDDMLKLYGMILAEYGYNHNIEPGQGDTVINYFKAL